MLKQAIEFQNMMGKIPGLGKLTLKNTQVMEQLLKMQQQQPSPSPDTFSSSSTPKVASPSNSNGDTLKAQSSSSSSTSAKSNNPVRGGPTLDELRRVNLGPEIEALFKELQAIRSKKNEYRDELFTTQAALTNVKKEMSELSNTEASLRRKLAKAEQDVMLLTSENIEIRESAKGAKQLVQQSRQLSAEVKQLRAEASTAITPGSVTYGAIKQQLKEKDDALRSLQRKLDRMRRRDPLLQFSLSCSDVGRLCAAGYDTGKDDADNAFAALQQKYQARQQEAWRAASQEDGAAAKAYVAVVQRCIASRIPHANYDAVVNYTGDRAALNAFFTELGFRVEFGGLEEEHRATVTAAADAAPFQHQPGPFGYAMALRCSGAPNAASGDASSPHPSLLALSFAVTSAVPFVSEGLLDNQRRAAVEYEAARASGPGGQATNVTETQVYAKLSIDGKPAYTAEAQESRSAMSNREAALEKLRHKRRQQYNDTLMKQTKVDTLQQALLDVIVAQGGFTMEPEVMQLTRDAVAAHAIPAGDAALVALFARAGHLAATKS